MIQRNNNLSILPFYRERAELNHNRSYAYGEAYPLYVPLGMVPPFQIIYPHTGAYITFVRLCKPDGTVVSNIRDQLYTGGMLRPEYDGFGYDYDIILYPSFAPANLTTAEGRYFLWVGLSDGAEWFSDFFTVTAMTAGLLNIQWWDVKDLIMNGERIVYANIQGENIYKNTLWLNTQLGRPEYDFEETGENRDGYFFPEKMISEKRYKCTFLAPEYLCDVMRFIRLSDFVFVRDQYGNAYRCDTFLITPKWEAQGDLASVEMEFTCDTVAKKIGQYIVTDGVGDYNGDYNNDYDITSTN